MKKMIITNIPKNKECFLRVLSYVNETDKWNKYDIEDWIESGCDYIFFDNIKNEYGYTNYQQDSNSEWFKNKDLEYIDYKYIKNK
jgi:hypothetical protein